MVASNSEQQRQNRAKDVAERIGDGKQLTVEDFGLLAYDERVHLHQVNPHAYQALSQGRNPGDKWRPSVHGATQGVEFNQ